MATLPALLLLAATAFLIAAVALLILGLRGRRINDHAICRACRFDLVGLYPGAAACPECGRSLDRTHAVRIGQRRTRRGMAITGAALLTLVLLCGGFVAVQSARGFNWNTIKPTKLLVWEAARSDDAGPIAELVARRARQQLDPKLLAPLIEPLLTRQANLARTWDPNLSELFIAAWEAGVATDEQALRYVKAAVNLSLSVAAKGEALNVLAAASNLRGGYSPAFFVELAPVSAAFDSRPPEASSALHLNFALQTGLTNSDSHDFTVTDPAARTLTLTWRARAGGLQGPKAGTRLGSWDISHTLQIPKTITPTAERDGR